MHGLINRSIQSFVLDTYGAACWRKVARASAGIESFELMLPYETWVTTALLEALADRLGKTVPAVLEDFGTHIVAHPSFERLRRLLRFGGVSFEAFLFSLEDLPDRARLAVPDFPVPRLTLEELGEGRYRLICQSQTPGYGRVLAGILRAMADDYGALVFLECSDVAEEERIEIDLLEITNSAGRRFDLAGAAE